MKRIEARSKALSDRLAALSEHVRLRIMRLLERNELSVGEVAKVLQLPQSTVSRHLKTLAEADWVFRRAEGTATLYRVTVDDFEPDARSLWLAIREQLTEGPEWSEDLHRLRSVLAERRADSQAFFGRVAGEWDSLRSELFGSDFTLDGLLTLIPRNWVVADLGCGTGNVGELLAPIVRRIIAVDRSQPMLEAARKRLEGASSVEFRIGQLEAIPIAGGEVDLAVAALVLHHVESPPAVCGELRRILRPGGRVLIIDMVEHTRETYRHTMGHRWLGFSEQAVRQLLEGAGLRDVHHRILPSSAEARGPGLFACCATAPRHDEPDITEPGNTSNS